MNTFVFTCLLCFVASSVLSAQASKTNSTSELSGGTGVWGSAGGLQTHPRDDDELEVDDELSGGSSINSFDFHSSSRDDKKRRKGKGKKRNKHKLRMTTALRPAHTISTHSSTLRTTEDPCTSTHLGYCIHGYCQRIEGLQEPVCICMKGFDGERCGIQTLEVNRPTEGNDSELLQNVLVVIAVVLSVLSCIGILLMTCAHYRSHKHFVASYLGTGAEQEKLQKPTADLIV